MITELAFLLFLILLNAFFAASEIALISLNDNKLRIQAESGDKKAILIQSLLKEPGRFLATIQIGITLAGFLASAYASETFADRSADYLAGIFPTVSVTVLKTASMIAITLILSYFTLVLGELVPKRLAMKKAEVISRIIAKPLNVLYVCTAPFVKFLSVSTNFFVRLFGVNPDEEDERVTEEEIRMMVDVGEERGAIHETEKQMINNIFEFNNKNVADIMTHRIKIAALPVDASFDDTISILKSEQYSRIPVYKESIDNIVGILHSKDILSFMAENPSSEGFSLENLIREPMFVPETKRLDLLFTDMQAGKRQMAVAIDEYGGTAGIVTIEDLLEEIVGNIVDEYDDEEQEITEAGDREFLVDGSINLFKLRDFFLADFPVEDFDTVGGFVTGLLDRIPVTGDVAEWNNFVFTAEQVQDKRITKVRVVVKTENEDDVI
ncbi:hemolysin family protein [Seleniivibrio woodruffii]|uniref:Putative hemolysin n=1 Tax=Seleniivibrio woodruffii TaxID=1078050 RepID=A0A4R1KB75_9BACT|nr:hemolysin family protein [Seleniivibrio woodruffii]TCK61715.1 putative hemolysin [Seleniivibrio woodruffii]TVZ35170.1 putative hemolysin [Seleniivibrio woodruffii]